jgi:hypothetical protein
MAHSPHKKNKEVNIMTQHEKDVLLALIDGLTKEKGNQYYTEKYLGEKDIETLKTFIKNFS